MKVICWFGSRKTIPRFIILAIITIIWLKIWPIIFDHNSLAYFIDWSWLKQNFESATGSLFSLQMLILGLPTAVCIWSFRNTDKKIDHDNAKIAQEQFLMSLKKEDIYRLIEIFVGDITVNLSIEIPDVELKGGQTVDKISLEEIIDIDPALNDSYYQTTEDRYSVKSHWQLLEILRLYPILIRYLNKYEELVGHSELSEHYAKQARYLTDIHETPNDINDFIIKYL